jgi:hypothetical protein
MTKADTEPKATIAFELPRWAMEAVSAAPDEFAGAVRLAAAMFWYGRSDITMGTGAAIAGLDLRGFLTALSQHEQDIFRIDGDDLDRELSLLAELRTRNGAGG